MRVLILLCGVFWFASCSSDYYMNRGRMFSETGRYYKAITQYEKAYDKVKPKQNQFIAALRAGESCERINRLKEAYSWYRRAERINKEQPEIYLRIARICYRINDMETAKQYYQKQKELFGGTKGEDGLYFLEQFRKEMEAEGRYEVHFKRPLNSRNSDFAPLYFPGDTSVVYFASTRKPNVKKKKIKIDPVTGEGYSHLYKSQFVRGTGPVSKKGRWLPPVLLKDSLWSGRNEGAVCFTADGEVMYFTSSGRIKGNDEGTRIYKATRQSEENGSGKEIWIKVGLAGICGDTVSIGHPALTPEGDRMYFVSDCLSGGYGGKDIWYVENKAGKWSEPVNAGELVNTSEDEMFPYIRENGELYFASNGHQGLGGLDIYKIEKKEGKEVLTHLPAPLNSYADDFGIVFKPGLEEGLLTSTRSGRNDNIYNFKYIPQQLVVKLLVFNTITELPVGDVRVTVRADDGSVAYERTDSAGRLSIPLLADKEYIFITENDRYLKGKGTLSTYGEKADRQYELSVGMQPIEKPIVIPDIYFDVAKWDLRPDAMENLKELLQILKDNPNIVIELSAHTDAVGDDEANKILSENRVRTVVDYLMEKGVYWDRVEAKGYGEMQPRQINEKEAREYPYFKVGQVLEEKFVNQLKGKQKETALQLNRRIEFKVLRTDYQPGPASLRPLPRQTVLKETTKADNTQLKSLMGIKGKFYTIQLGVFRNVPRIIHQFKVVYTEKLKNGTTRYCTGIYSTREKAVYAARELKKKGIDCLVKEMNQ